RENVTRKRRLCATILRDVVCVTLFAACHRDASMLRVSGTVEIREVQLASLAAGRLVRLLKDEGDTVRQGDTLAVLEQPGLDALISQRRAQAKAAGLRTAEVAAAQADSARAADELARAEPLRRQNIVSQQQYEALKAAATAAAARGAHRARARRPRVRDQGGAGQRGRGRAPQGGDARHARAPPLAVTQAAVETRNLTRRFGALTAVRQLTLRIEEGEVFGLLGPN